MNKYLSDKLKAISFVLMIMVVFLHSYNLEIKHNSKIILIENGWSSFIQYFICKGITTISVPLFFIISGYLFFLNINDNFLIQYKKKITKRITTLALPYVLWSTYGLLFIFILQTIPISRPFFNNELVIDYPFYKILSAIFIHPVPYQLWFIRDLIILILLSPIWYWLLKNFKQYILFIFIITWFIEFNYVIFSHEALLFFMLGGFLGLNRISLQHLNLKKVSLYILMIWLSSALIETSLMYNNYEKEWLITILHKTEILLGIMAVWGMYDYFNERNSKDISKTKVYFLFQFSFFLYAFHEPVLSIYRKGLNKLIGHSELQSLVVFILSPSLTIISSILLGYFLKKYFYKFYFLTTGGR